MTEPVSDDAVERELGPALHRLADDAPTSPLDGGRQLVERRVRQRAARRRQALGAGMAVAAVALVGGVLALRHDPPTKLDFADAPAGPGTAEGVVTGYATGSMTGSPTGWSSNYDVSADAVDLPRYVADLGAGWQPHRVSAVVSDQGSGQSPTPLLVLADGASYVVASVQPVTKLGPGKGPEEQIGGHAARVTRRKAGAVQAVVDLDASTRAMVTSAGIDAGALSAVVGSIRQEGDHWTMDAPAGSKLTPVATEAPSSYRQRTIEWGTGADPRVPPTTATTLPGDPSADHGETLTLSVSTGGAYEFWGLVGEHGGWEAPVPVAQSPTQLAGVTLVGAGAYLGDYGSTLIAYDAQGLVYELDRYAFTNKDESVVDGVTPDAPVAPLTVALTPATAESWTQLVTAAAAYDAETTALNADAAARKQALVDALGNRTAPPPSGAPAATVPPGATSGTTTTSVPTTTAAPTTTTP